jgi:hypothetical protein
MANGHGGLRRPANPAPVSGPGALSRRTDGKQPMMDLPNAKYGENAAYRAAESAAPMSQSTPPGQGTAPPTGPDLSNVIPFGAPSARPDEPVTAGLPGGPGAGPSVPPQPARIDPAAAARIQSYLPVLVMLASQDDADPNTRQLVRQIRADL